MREPSSPTDLWPFFGLTVTTPKLTLRMPSDEDLVAVAHASDRMVPDGEQPFSDQWHNDDPAARHREVMTRWWAERANLNSDYWKLSFVVVVDGEVVGRQAIWGKQFAATRFVTTASWLSIGVQGRGIGTDMREAILHLAFAGLDATWASSRSAVTSHASARISEKLGYQPNGMDVLPASDGTPFVLNRFLLTADQWQPYRRDDIAIEGLDRCLPLLSE